MKKRLNILLVNKKNIKEEVIKGKLLNLKDEPIRENTDCYYKDETGREKLLFKFRKNVIPEKLAVLARNIFQNYAKKVNNQRSVASGGRRICDKNGITYSSEICRSSIAGYYDKPNMRMKKEFPSDTICRETSFTKKYKNEWEFFQHVSNYYKHLAPEYYKKQLNAINKLPAEYKIKDTVFTTITINYNWRTACHKDSGDFEDGMGNLTIIGDDSYEGGYLYFPEFGVSVDVRPNDIIIMDVHQYHCNTPLKANDKNARISFVCYLRKNMLKCNTYKIVNNEKYYIYDPNKIKTGEI